MEVKLATSAHIPALLPALLALRPHLTAADITQRLPGMFAAGYAIAFLGDDNLVWSLAGFRIQDFLYSGRTLYVDDLSTLPEYRQRGLAKTLFDWLKEHALSQKCSHFSLDSGFQRQDAHRFYLNQGLNIESLHFGSKLP